jgi:hypothetical protein
MNVKHGTFGFALFLCCLAGMTRTTSASPTTIPTTAHAAFKHEPSGFVFPPSITGFTRVDTYRYDARGDDISVGYNDDSNLVAATICVYPRGKDDVETHFRQVTDEIEVEHAGAKQVSRDKAMVRWSRPGLTEEWQFLHATYEFSGFFARENRQVLSEAYFMVKGPRWLLVRITYPKDKAEAARKAIEAFLPELMHPPKE